MATQLDEGVPTPLKVTRPRKAAAAPGTATKAARTRKATTGPVAATKVSRPRKAMTDKAVTPEAKAAPKPVARKPAMVPVAELIEAPALVAERMAPEPAHPVPVTAPPRRFRFSRLFSWLGPVRKTRSSAAG